MQNKHYLVLGIYCEQLWKRKLKLITLPHEIIKYV